MQFPCINSLLARKDKYESDAWINMPQYRRSLEQTELILQALIDCDLLPQGIVLHDIADWLMHNAPITQLEKLHIRRFLFEIDYY